VFPLLPIYHQLIVLNKGWDESYKKDETLACKTIQCKSTEIKRSFPRRDLSKSRNFSMRETVLVSVLGWILHYKLIFSPNLLKKQ